MTLRQRVAFVHPTSWPLLLLFGGAAALFAIVFGWSVAFTAVIAMALFVVFTRFTPTILVRRAFRRLGRLVAAQEHDAARALLGELRELYAAYPKQLAHLRMMEAGLLSREGRNTEACSLLESLDRTHFAGVQLAHLLNSLAWSLTQTGRAHEAVPLARASLEASSDSAGELRGYQLGTLGSALALDGQAAEAIMHLEEALIRKGTAWALSIRAFYLGEALRALGRHDEAAKAYARATEADPNGFFAACARDALQSFRPYR
jgi:tetratricopeptide (TPR) repeat protein